ncbi:glycoside hydrolase family 55 protein [Planococcus sp. A6]|uniref:glycosyl hydrolase family 28-related protein n=1 Tax=Planococcus sp. A6 TaxID=2992760 RepID=UPI00237B648C|nr:glycosyl hydrolase family 28-related protein [Planococcus sp. A6]MDE0584068.1 glycoside hydrolase family 55 protein [Planococcus sp. A6]
MIELDRRYDPVQNNELIGQLLNDATPLEQTTRETEALFNDIKKDLPRVRIKRPVHFFEKLWSVFADEYEVADDNGYGTIVFGQDLFPEWKGKLDREYKKLDSTINRRVNIRDYGAIGDGITDCTEAFKKAIGNGRVEVTVPPGVYIVKGIRVPSWSRIVGAGKTASVIKLHPKAPKRSRLLTNSNYVTGNRNISIESLSLDWNVERLGQTERTNAWGNYSSCVTFAGVTYGWVRDVEAINPGLHCVDITSPLYNYAGDGMRGRGGSKYIWVDKVNGFGFGDDGLTTHHSDYVFVSNCHFSDPSGKAHKKGYSNSNGIEIDDGSRHVWLFNNSTSRCFGGIEIKAHANSSAASGVFISGHLSVNDNRSFNFRHIGHHLREDPESLSAYNIKAQRLVSLAPVETRLYKDSSPRSLVISGYRNVAINRFLFEGDPLYDYKGRPASAVQYRAEHISLSNGVVRGFRTAGSDISIMGGKQSARNVRVKNIMSVDSSNKTVAVGDDSKWIMVDGIRKQKADRL